MPLSKPTVLSILGAAMLFGMAALHGSGYPYVAGTIHESELPDFLKSILPPLFLYPSALLVLLALATLVSLGQPAGRTSVLMLVAAIVAANAIFGFVLGGAIPGGVLLFAAAVFAFAARKAMEDSVGART